MQLDRRFIGAFNFFIVQWFCYRVAWTEDDTGIILGWGMLGPVAPLTGWVSGPWPKYRWLGKR